MGDLSTFLTRPNSHDWDIKHHLYLDMSARLDALHKQGIVHADFKPQNVLVFQEQTGRVPFIAKLSDFGFFISDVKENDNNAIYITGWTEGWQAPEIDHHRDVRKSITTEGYRKADIYSFGLVVWSAFFLLEDHRLSLQRRKRQPAQLACLRQLQEYQTHFDKPATLH